MLNYIWFALMAIALIIAAVNGSAEEVSRGALESAKTAVEISIGLVGVMALWLGIMRIAEAAGLVQMLARIIAPVGRFLFPGIPRDHPAMGAIVMSIAANMLGLNNAATPLGIRAMEDMQKLNGEKETATNAMVMFLSLNTASIQLVPATMVAILAAAGSKQPTVIIGSTLIATAIGTVFAIVITKILEPFYGRSAPPPAADAPAEEAA